MTSETKQTKKANFLGSQSPNKPSISKPALSVTSDSRSRKSNIGFPSKSTASSIIGSRRQLVPTTAGAERQGQVSRKEIRLYNEAGEDVTPRPLLQQDASRKTQQPAVVTAESSGGTPTEHASQTSVYQAGPVNASTFGGALFTRSIFSASESGRSNESVSDEFGEQTPDFTSSFTGTDLRVEFKHEDHVEIPTEEELLKVVDLKLSETETLWLLDMPSVCAMSESEEALVILDRNLRYQELTKSRVGNDRYTERWMNTFNDAMKNKNIQTDKITHSDAGAYASIWDMYDTYNENKVETNEDDDEIVLSAEPSVIKSADGDEGVEPPVTTRTSSTLQALLPEKLSVTDTASRTLSSVGVGDSVIGGKETRRTTNADEKPVDTQILETDNMKRHLVIVERIINLNTYQPKQALYRNFTPLIDVDRPVTPVVVVDKSRKRSTVASKIEVVADYGPNLDRLWSYQCPMTRGRNVSAISWNRVNPDLVAVGYGQFEYMKQKGGLLCCWSVKNPEFPERVYPTASGVMCVDFSRAHPNLLAAGLHDGTIAIFNVGMSTNEPVLDSSEAPGKHTSPVFQLQWIEKERGSADEHTEVLVSVSTDGRVTQWAIRKGFESYDLMKLKRIAEKQTQSSKGKKNDAMISKFAGGLCFDFTAKDSNIYLVGTEDGHIHRCSCSYNEQYLDSYFGHTGPVYTVKWSPFDPNVFLSSSGDWSVRLWHQDRLQPVLNLFSSTKAVPNLCWSPRSSTVFACVNEGALELWDLSQNTLDPILVNVPSSPDTKLSAVSFARNTECILVGDSDGQVIIYQLRGMPIPPDNQIEVLQQVINSSLASQLKK